MFALVDGNNFYASCQQVFENDVRAMPLGYQRHNCIRRI